MVAGEGREVKAMHRAYIAVGSNLGTREETIRRAALLVAADRHMQLTRAASLIETKPLPGGPHQGDYLNTVWEIDTSYAPETLLTVLLSIEQKLGRVRTVKNAPRTIDLDILFFDELCMTTEQLIIPHPRLHEREFLLRLLNELVPDMQHPVLGKTLHALWMEKIHEDNNAKKSAATDTTKI